MKKLSLLLFSLFLITKSFSQEGIFEFVGQEAKYPGGMKALYQHLGNTIVYPKECADKNIQGKVFVKFVIEKDGSIGEAIVMNKGRTHAALEEESLRVIRALPNWEPAKNNGVIVRYWQKLPINFKVKEENYTSMSTYSNESVIDTTIHRHYFDYDNSSYILDNIPFSIKAIKNEAKTETEYMSESTLHIDIIIEKDGKYSRLEIKEINNKNYKTKFSEKQLKQALLSIEKAIIKPFPIALIAEGPVRYVYQVAIKMD